MNLLSKLNSSAKTKTIEPREIFMTLPSKAPGYGYPRDVQSEVWKKWFDIRNEKNVILKMNTGSGKTVVGLIMLQSCLNEEKGPAIYVVPDNFLGLKIKTKINKKIVGYCRVSSTKQKDDLERQIENVRTYMIAKGYQFEIITDIGSGINYNKKGLNQLIDMITNSEIEKVVILYKDR